MATQQLPVDRFPSTRKSAVKKVLRLILIVAAAVVLTVAVLFVVKWPFTRERVARRLAEATATRVKIGGFQARYFPRPGCIARGVIFQPEGSSSPRMTIQTLTIRGSFPGLITGHISFVRGDGVHISLPPFGRGQSLGGSNQSGMVIDELVADGTVLEILPKKAEGRPTRFLLRQFRLRGLGGNRVLSFQTVLDNPKPPGVVSASGTFGPWETGKAASTPVSGRYLFRHADLGVFRGIAGILSSGGTFRGTFQNLQVQGTTETPDFEAAHSGHKFDLSTQFRALVNATNGDVTLRSVAALLGRTTVGLQGSIAGTQQGLGKTAALDFGVQDGRIEDVLLLFVKDRHSPLMGITSFRAHIIIPPGPTPFVRKVQLQGEFGISQAEFSKPKTEKSLSVLSQRARGNTKNDEDPERVLSDLRGQVTLANGVATFSHIRFVVPGARVQMQGTYNLTNERVNLHGLLHMDTKLTKATKGITSFLLKALSPFLKSNHPGEVLPVSITGTYDHPSYHMSPSSRK